MLDERTVWSRRQAPLMAARAHRSGDFLGADSVRSKVAPLALPVSPCLPSWEASRNIWRSIGPSAMLVFKLRTSL